MKINSEKFCLKISARKCAMKDYRQNPGDLDCAVFAALHTAKRINNRVIVIPGNSYMNLVYHITTEDKDLMIFTASSKPADVFIVYPDGTVNQSNVTR